MAGPVAHIFVALTLLQSQKVEIKDKLSYIAASPFPDIRYIDPISRAKTHQLDKPTLTHALDTDSSFEAGRRLHVLLDKVRERYMVKNDAYRHVPDTHYKTQLLKLLEDEYLFSRLKGQFDVHEVFSKIYAEERAYGLDESTLKTWHQILETYLSPHHAFNWLRYYRTLKLYKMTQKPDLSFLGQVRSFFKTAIFMAYGYFQLKDLQKNEELKRIIFAFYNNSVAELMNTEGETFDEYDILSQKMTPLDVRTAHPAQLARLGR